MFSSDLLDFMAGVLQNMNSRGAYVVHGQYETGAGLDELTTTGPCRIAHLHDAEITLLDMDPADMGFRRSSLVDLQGGDAETNAAIARALLSGELTGPETRCRRAQCGRRAGFAERQHRVGYCRRSREYGVRRGAGPS